MTQTHSRPRRRPQHHQRIRIRICGRSRIRTAILLTAFTCTTGLAAYVTTNGCVPYLDDTGKTCTETCPSGLPCINGTCGGNSADANGIDAPNANNDGSSQPKDDAALDVDAGSNVDAGPPLKMYTYTIQTNQWSTSPLANFWNGPNAPPLTGIQAVTQLTDEDRLLVFADDGKFYLRSTGVWQTPVPISDKWLPLTAPPRSISHLPRSFKVLNDPSAPDEETLTLVDNPKVYLFSYKPNDAVTFVLERMMNPGDAAVREPSVTGHIRWSYEILSLGNPNPAERYQFWDLYDDNNLYEINANIDIKVWPLASSPFWVNHANAPPPTGQAAYWDNGTNTVHVIGP